MKHFLCTFFLLSITIITFSQSEIATCKKIANHILESHSNQMTTDEKGNLSIKSYYQEWRYVNGVLALSMLDLADETKDNRYRTFVKDNYEFFFNADNNRKMKV